jgi:hypothetical protein
VRDHRDTLIAIHALSNRGSEGHATTDETEAVGRVAWLVAPDGHEYHLLTGMAQVAKDCGQEEAVAILTDAISRLREVRFP